MPKTKSTSTNIKELTKEVNKKLDTLAKKHGELAKETKKVSKQAVSLLKELINSTPYIEAVRWEQYTPYFMDVDPCEFGVHDIQFKFSQELTGAGDKDADEENSDNDGFLSNDYDNIDEFLDKKKDILNFKEIDKLEKIVKELYRIHGSLIDMGDTLKDAFGDHVKVVVTRKGIETEECQHE